MIRRGGAYRKMAGSRTASSCPFRPRGTVSHIHNDSNKQSFHRRLLRVTPCACPTWDRNHVLLLTDGKPAGLEQRLLG